MLNKTSAKLPSLFLFFKLIFLFISILFISSCGIKGDLTIPKINEKELK